MKTLALATAAFLMVGGAAMAQTSDATKLGTQTAPSNGAGTPEATSSAGTVSTTTVAPSGSTTSTTPAPVTK